MKRYWHWLYDSLTLFINENHDLLGSGNGGSGNRRVINGGFNSGSNGGSFGGFGNSNGGSGGK